MGSAITVTGVGPRFTFTVGGTVAGLVAGGGLTTDNLIGTVTATWEGTGKYHIKHNLGNTAYVAQFTTENSGARLGCGLSGDRGTNGITLSVDISSTGVAWDSDFIHGVIHDGGG